MAETTIEWTATILADGTKLPGYTFNPWTQCTPVSAGCQNCYASALIKRFTGESYKKGVPRQRTSEANWKKPLAWNRAAEKSGIRRKVFCASLADVFDAEAPDEWRIDLFDLIRQTPHLDWLILSKRPENILHFVNKMQKFEQATSGGYWRGWLFAGLPPSNVWLGTSVEDERVIHRVNELCKVPAKVRFLSVEPMLGALNIHEALYGEVYSSSAGRRGIGGQTITSTPSPISWVICGGESGPGARPFAVEWARGLMTQCEAAGVPFFMKQMGAFPVVDYYCEDDALREWAFSGRHTVLNADGIEWREFHGQPSQGALIRFHLRDKKGGDESEWPEDLRVRQFPEVSV